MFISWSLLCKAASELLVKAKKTLRKRPSWWSKSEDEKAVNSKGPTTKVTQEKDKNLARVSPEVIHYLVID